MRRRFASLPFLLLATACVLAAGCEGLPGMGSQTTADTTRAPGVPGPGEGLVTVATAQSVQATAQQLKSAIEASGATLMAEIDHAQNAGGPGDSLSLRPTRLFIFGNPALGTPLMQNVRAAGIDLPQKMLVWQGAADSTRVTYNAPAYLAARHDLSGVSASLGQMSGALTALAEQAAGRAPETLAFNADSISAGGGLAVTTSDFGFEETFSRLEGAVQSHPQLSIMARIDHARNAATADSLRADTSSAPSGPSRDNRTLDERFEQASSDGLPPTRLLLFGNPAAGTPLMRQAPTMGIDLPQKMLVYEGGEGDVFVVYNEPAYLARRHEVADTTGLSRIAQTLEGLAFDATSDAEEIEQLRQSRDSSGVSF